LFNESAARGLVSSTWKTDLAGLAVLDWSRTSLSWQGRALVNGRVAKNAASVVLTANALKKLLGLELGVEDRQVEGLRRRSSSENG